MTDQANCNRPLRGKLKAGRGGAGCKVAGTAQRIAVLKQGVKKFKVQLFQNKLKVHRKKMKIRQFGDNKKIRKEATDFFAERELFNRACQGCIAPLGRDFASFVVKCKRK